MPKYRWQDMKESPVKQLQKLNHHRERMIEAANDHSNTILDETIKEWNMLLEERDKALKKVIDKENEVIYNSHMEELFRLLKVIGKLDHSRTPSSLRTALCFAHQEVKSYLSTENIHTGNIDILRNTTRLAGGLDTSNLVDSTDHSDMPVSIRSKTHRTHSTGGNATKALRRSNASHLNMYSRRRVQFTPTESPLASAENLPTHSGSRGSDRYFRKTPTSTSQVGAVRYHSSSPYQTSRPQTPKASTHGRQTPSGVDENNKVLRCSLLKGKENLRSTPGIERSPGGTPHKGVRSFNLSDAGDFVAVALKRKFLNMRRLYGSPQNINDDSIDEDPNLSTDSFVPN